MESRSLRDRLAAKPGYQWYALGVLTLVYASNQLDRQIMAILLEPIKLELGASDTQMGFLVGMTFALFYATLGMPIAMLADRTNRRNIITTAVTVWSAFTVACGYAGSFVQLALARIGVGVGEAGSTPPSHSMISDLFPPEKRATAMGIFAVGVNIGLLVAYLGGGWLSEHYGWRWTFIIIGAPGLLLALLMYLTVIEPKRGGNDSKAVAGNDDDATPGFWEVAGHLWKTRTTRHVITGASLAAFIGYGFVLWLPSFFARSHGLDPSEIGLILALMTGVVGGLGTYASGHITDILARRDVRWRCWYPAVAKTGYVPFLIAFFMVDNLWVALALYIVPGLLGSSYLAPTFSMIQGLVTLRMRALASAILLFVINIIGLGLGPQIVGILSDLFRTMFGNESLRMSLMFMSVLNIWCGFHYFLAARTLKDDLAKTEYGSTGPESAH